jgi:apolipoprotein N-acyltransferase
VHFNTNQTGREITFALIQENIPPERKWSEETGDQNARMFFELNQKVASRKPDIILWTETALPWVFSTDDDFLQQVLSITKPSGAAHIIGYLTEAEQNTDQVFNSAILVEADGAVRSMSHKSNLLSGIEEPLVQAKGAALQIPALTTSINQNIASGKKNEVLRTKFGVFGNLICNEALRAELARKKVKQGAELLLVMSNNGWFNDQRLLMHHFYITRLAAVATRRDVVINSNRGVSGGILSSGEIQLKSKSESPQLVSVTARKNKQFTLYTNYSDFPILAGFFAVSVLLIIKHKNQKNEN